MCMAVEGLEKLRGHKNLNLYFESWGFGVRRMHWTVVRPFFIGKGGDWRHGCDHVPKTNPVMKRVSRLDVKTI